MWVLNFWLPVWKFTGAHTQLTQYVGVLLMDCRSVQLKVNKPLFFGQSQKVPRLCLLFVLPLVLQADIRECLQSGLQRQLESYGNNAKTEETNVTWHNSSHKIYYVPARALELKLVESVKNTKCSLFAIKILDLKFFWFAVCTFDIRVRLSPSLCTAVQSRPSLLCLSLKQINSNDS